MLGDTLQALLQVVPLQRRADLPDQVLLVGLQVHSKVSQLGDVVVVHRLLVFFC